MVAINLCLQVVYPEKIENDSALLLSNPALEVVALDQSNLPH
jgi:hypothetical protein